MSNIVNLKQCKVHGCTNEMADSIGSKLCASCTVNTIRRFALVSGDSSLDNMTIEKILFWLTIIKKDWKKLVQYDKDICRNDGKPDPDQYP